MEIIESSIPKVDDLAKEEQESLINSAKRKEHNKATSHKITTFLLWAIVIIVVVIGGIRLIHLVLPENCQWLKPEALSKIDEFFIHGTVGAILAKFLENKISLKEDQ